LAQRLTNDLPYRRIIPDIAMSRVQFMQSGTVRKFFAQAVAVR